MWTGPEWRHFSILIRPMVLWNEQHHVVSTRTIEIALRRTAPIVVRRGPQIFGESRRSTTPFLSAEYVFVGKDLSQAGAVLQVHDWNHSQRISIIFNKPCIERNLMHRVLRVRSILFGIFLHMTCKPSDFALLLNQQGSQWYCYGADGQWEFPVLECKNCRISASN